MRVRQQDGVDPVDTRAQHLGSKIGRRVDQHVAAAVAQQHRGTQAVIARVGRQAYGAFAADRRHTGTGPRAEHDDAQTVLGHVSFRAISSAG